MSLFNLQRWLGKQIDPEKHALWRLRLGPVQTKAVIGLDLEEEHGLEVQGGFEEREVRVLVRIVSEAARC